MDNTISFFAIDQSFGLRHRLKPNSQILFSYLSDCDLAGLDLTNCYFLGCVFDNVNFETAIVTNTVFEYCFVVDDQYLSKMTLSNASQVLFTSGNVRINDMGRLVKFTNEYDTILQQSTSSDIQDIIKAIKFYNQQPIDGSIDLNYLFAIAHLLQHHEFDIRNAAFHSFCELHYLSFKTSKVEDFFKEYLLRSAAETNDLIYYDAANLIEKYDYSDKIIQRILDQIHSPLTSEQLNGLRYINHTKYKGDWYERLVVFDEVVKLLNSSNHQLVIETLHFILTHPVGKYTAQEIDAVSGYLPRLLQAKNTRIQELALKIIAYIRVWEKTDTLYQLLNNDNIKWHAWDTLMEVLPLESIPSFLEKYPAPRAKRLAIADDEAYLETSCIISNTKLAQLLHSQYSEDIIIGLDMLTYLKAGTFTDMIVQYCKSENTSIKYKALQALSYDTDNVDSKSISLEAQEVDQLLGSKSIDDLLSGIVLLKYVQNQAYINQKLINLKLHSSDKVRLCVLKQHYKLLKDLNFTVRFLNDTSEEVQAATKLILENESIDQLKKLTQLPEFKEQVQEIIEQKSYYDNFF
jgi:hypothetical protein